MLTYASVRDIADVMRNVERFSTVAEADEHYIGIDILVYDDDDLVLIFNIYRLWHVWCYRHRVREDKKPIPVPKWGRRVELYIRLRLKLRARHSRLRVKQRRDTAPQDQRTGEARPAV